MREITLCSTNLHFSETEPELARYADSFRSSEKDMAFRKEKGGGKIE